MSSTEAQRKASSSPLSVSLCLSGGEIRGSSVAKRGPNTEVTETLRALCVESPEPQRTRRRSFDCGRRAALWRYCRIFSRRASSFVGNRSRCILLNSKSPIGNFRSPSFGLSPFGRGANSRDQLLSSAAFGKATLRSALRRTASVLAAATRPCASPRGAYIPTRTVGTYAPPANSALFTTTNGLGRDRRPFARLAQAALER